MERCTELVAGEAEIAVMHVDQPGHDRRFLGGKINSSGSWV